MIESKIVHTPRGSLLDTWKTCREGDIDEDSQQPHQTPNRKQETPDTWNEEDINHTERTAVL